MASTTAPAPAASPTCAPTARCSWWPRPRTSQEPALRLPRATLRPRRALPSRAGLRRPPVPGPATTTSPRRGPRGGGRCPSSRSRPREELRRWLGDAWARLAMLPLDKLLYDPSGAKSFTVKAHWALYVENYLEGLHVPFVHPGLRGRWRWGVPHRAAAPRGAAGGGARDDDDALMPADPLAPTIVRRRTTSGSSPTRC
jgi:hypothetical protein